MLVGTPAFLCVWAFVVSVVSLCGGGGVVWGSLQSYAFGAPALPSGGEAREKYKRQKRWALALRFITARLPAVLISALTLPAGLFVGVGVSFSDFQLCLSMGPYPLPVDYRTLTHHQAPARFVVERISSVSTSPIKVRCFFWLVDVDSFT